MFFSDLVDIAFLNWANLFYPISSLYACIDDVSDILDCKFIGLTMELLATHSDARLHFINSLLKRIVYRILRIKSFALKLGQDIRKDK